MQARSGSRAAGPARARSRLVAIVVSRPDQLRVAIAPIRQGQSNSRQLLKVRGSTLQHSRHCEKRKCYLPNSAPFHHKPSRCGTSNRREPQCWEPQGVPASTVLWLNQATHARARALAHGLVLVGGIVAVITDAIIEAAAFLLLVIGPLESSLQS